MLQSKIYSAPLVFILILIIAASARAQTLEHLRADYAMRYLEPDAHMALAKFFYKKGDRLQAFFILEEARRGRFEEEVFNRAFETAFRGAERFDNSPQAEAALLEEYRRDPTSYKTVTRLADIYISRDEWAKAKEYLSKALALRPDDFDSTSALAEVLSREGNEPEAHRILTEYARKYPDSVAGYEIRISELMESNAARSKQLLMEAIRKFPSEGQFPFDLGVILQREGNLAEAEQNFVNAARLAPDSVQIQSWVGRFFFKVRQANTRALEYYFNAYFLSPDAYETEFVESRIRTITWDAAELRYKQLMASHTPMATILNDANSSVIIYALDRMAESWQSSYLPLLLNLMGHDDGGVRWQATQLIKNHADRSFDETLRALLKSADLRVRGLAAYIAVHLWGRESFDIMRSMLREEAQLLRFDALSALVLEGGPEGLRIVREHASHETNPTLKKLIDSTATRQGLNNREF